MKRDYSETVFAKGIVCINTNNNTKCVVLDGCKGTESDRCSIVLEKFSDHMRTHCPPNRALIPTGEYIDVTEIEKILTIGE